MPHPQKHPVDKKFRLAGLRQGWWGDCDILAAVSGGGDSMALLHMLCRLHAGRVAVAHFEHGIRGGAALEDAAFVEAYCRKRSLRCFVRHGRVPENRRNGESLEMAGRRLRYEFFAELAERHGFPFVATGHTADDAVETMLLNLFRGTGIRGMAGIPGARGKIARPLIYCGREELRRLLAAEGVPWREDATNAESLYRRNKVRNELLPWLRGELNPAVDAALLGLAGESAAHAAAISRDAHAVADWLRRPHPFALAAWDADAARGLADARLAQAIRAQGEALSLPVPDRRRVEELCRLMRENPRWRFQWAEDVEVCGAAALFGWLRRGQLLPQREAEAVLCLGDRRTVAWGDWTVALDFRRRDDFPVPAGRRNAVWSALLPTAGASVAVRVRSADCPENGRRNAIPWWSRMRWPLVALTAAEGENYWQPGRLCTVQNESTYAIMARVFCDARRCA